MAPRLRRERIVCGPLTLHHTYGGSGSPLLLIHGLGSAGFLEWRFNLEALARRHTVYAPDLPGFGLSDKPAAARYGIPLFTRTLVRYLQELRLRQVAVAGTSLGGRVALELALGHGQRVKRLVLVDALGLGRPKVQPLYPLAALPGIGELGMRAAGRGLQAAPDDLVRRIVARMAGATPDDHELLVDQDYLDQLRSQYADEGWRAAYLATVRSLLMQPRAYDVTARLPRLQLPVLIVWGTADPIFGLDNATRAHRLLPDSRLLVIEGAGHTPQAERPEQFNKALLDFLG